MDIIEAINLMPNNQVALHTTYGCFDNTTSSSQSGTVLQNDCSVPEGCIVAENKPNSYGQTFAAAGGGVWALQMDVSGIFVWFWSVGLFLFCFKEWCTDCYVCPATEYPDIYIISDVHVKHGYSDVWHANCFVPRHRMQYHPVLCAPAIGSPNYIMRCMVRTIPLSSTLHGYLSSHQGWRPLHIFHDMPRNLCTYTSSIPS